MSNGQFSNRNRQSATNEAAIIIVRAYAAWTDGDITGELQLDNKAAFPRVAKGSLHNKMRAKYIAGDLV
jgi:hypothetical protein